jgi:hypothetical protein
MNFRFRHSALLLMIIYMLIPVAGFAHVDIPTAAAIDLRLTAGAENEAPCDHCPCNDDQGSDCCGTTVCSCAFHSPPEQRMLIRYAPVVVLIRHTDSFWVLPQVYLPIFVPPQNQPVHLRSEHSGVVLLSIRHVTDATRKRLI